MLATDDDRRMPPGTGRTCHPVFGIPPGGGGDHHGGHGQADLQQPAEAGGHLPQDGPAGEGACGGGGEGGSGLGEVGSSHQRWAACLGVGCMPGGGRQSPCDCRPTSHSEVSEGRAAACTCSGGGQATGVCRHARDGQLQGLLCRHHALHTDSAGCRRPQGAHLQHEECGTAGNVVRQGMWYGRAYQLYNQMQ